MRRKDDLKKLIIKGEEFLKRKMTLITEPESDYYLNKWKESKRQS